MTPTSEVAEALPPRFPVRVYNWLRRERRRALEPDALLARASRRARLTDWGDDVTFLQGLRALTDAINEWPDTTPWGRLILDARILKALVVRLRLQHRMRTEPEVFARPVTRPLFIVGLTRTGTTFLQRLLAQDPRARTTRYWEVEDPMPAPAPETYEGDRRIVRARIELSITRYLAPRLQAIHPMAATWPEEDSSILRRAFGVSWWTLVANPAFLDWLDKSRPWYLPAIYRYHRAELQHLQSRFRIGHWLLKSPAHLRSLPALLEAYPDACVVHTHRDPRRTVPSTCSLRYAVLSGLEARIDASGLGERHLSRWERVGPEILQFRAAWPRANQFYDVHYPRLMADPVGTARGIYEHFELPWHAEFERRMAAFVVAEARARRATQHQYRAEQFGLTLARIDEAFAAYRQFFGVAIE